MKEYSHMISEVRWRYIPSRYYSEPQVRYGCVYREKRFAWDWFRWFDIKTIEWGDWRPYDPGGGV